MTTNPPADMTWRSRAWDYGTVSDHAQRFAMRLEKAGLEVRSTESGEPRLSWPEVVQAFADAAEDAVDQHVRHQREKAAHMNAHASTSEAPKEVQGQPHHICARFMIIGFFDGTDFRIDFNSEVGSKGWSVRNIRGVDMLIVGHGVPRKMFPLRNVRYFDLIPEGYEV